MSLATAASLLLSTACGYGSGETFPIHQPLTQKQHLYEWGAWYHGALHTHATDPELITTITGPFDPPF